MRAVVDAKDFSQALDKVSKALRKSKYVPALEEAMVRFSGGHCVLTGTDFDAWLTAEIPSRGDDFSFVFHRTANAAKACRRFDGDLVLELTEIGEGRDRRLKLCMSCGNRNGEFHAFFPEDYPKMPVLELEQSFTAGAASLLERVGRIKYATLKASPSADVRSTCIQFNGSRIFCLDGTRAAWDTDESLSVPAPFMVSAAPLEHLKIFGKQDVAVRLGKRHVDFTDGALHLVLRRAEAVPFDLDSAIPQQFREEIYISPDEFLSKLTYLKELIPNGKKAVIRFDGGRLLTQVDECRYQTRIQIDGRSEIVIGFNPNYLADALRQFKGEPRVRMKLTGPVSPVLLEAEGRGDSALVLPVRLKYVPATA